MAISVELHNTGNAAIQTEIRAVIEHVLSDRPGRWRVLIVGSQANDKWEMRVEGPHEFERSYTLEGSAGEHRVEVIRSIVERLLPARIGA